MHSKYYRVNLIQLLESNIIHYFFVMQGLEDILVLHVANGSDFFIIVTASLLYETFQQLGNLITQSSLDDNDIDLSDVYSEAVARAPTGTMPSKGPQDGQKLSSLSKQ